VELLKEIEDARQYIIGKIKIKPKIGIVSGTGLGRLSNRIDRKKVFPYQDIPNFPKSTLEDHQGNLILGSLGGKEIVAMQGRFHFYEGYSMEKVTFPVRVLESLGVEILIITNAGGGLNPQFNLEDIMLITDHINLTGDNPLIGPNLDTFGPRFPDMSQPYTKDLIILTERIALEEKIKLQKGVYVCVQGPSMETPAETHFLRMIGADAVGMSTVPEVIVAVHSGMKVLGLSVITNLNLLDSMKPHSYEEIIAIANKAAPRLMRLIERVTQEINV
jgi:purine-nucleoside phosphorylase